MDKDEPGVEVRELFNSEDGLIREIAGWYYKEWQTPVEKTIRRLTGLPNEDILCQLILTRHKKLIATGGLCYNVNILNVHPELKEFGPWVALLYTDKKFRRKGCGKTLLTQLEKEARKRNLNKLYLYTFTAENLYRRNGWKVIKRVPYKRHETAIMEKEL